MTSKTESDESYWYESNTGRKTVFDLDDSDEIVKTLNQFKLDLNPTQTNTAQPFSELLVRGDGSVDSSGYSSGDSLKSARYRNTTTGSSSALRAGVVIEGEEEWDIVQHKDIEVVEFETQSGNVAVKFSANSLANVFHRKPQQNDLKEHFTPTPAYATEVAKLEAEIQHLRRQSKDLPPVEDAVLKIICDEPYSLEAYRSRELKVSLVDAAIKYCDGNAIIRTLLHFKHNTKPSIFSQEIVRRPEAVNHYIAYLKLQGFHSELSDLLQMLGRTHESAMVQYKVALNARSTESTIKLLDNCLRNHFRNDPTLVHEAALVQEHLTLLEKQLPIDSSDAQQQNTKHVEVFNVFPRQMSLVNQSVLDTLYYCCLYHYDLKENHYASPASIRKEHRLNNKQFSYAACAALAHQQRWKSIDELVLTKSYLGKLKLRSDISITSILQLLHRKGAPPKMLQHYIRYRENVEARLELGKQYKCHDIVIEALVRLRDKEQLRFYAEKLPRMSAERRLAEDALRTLHS